MKLSKVILSKLHIPQPSQDICQRNGLLFAGIVLFVVVHEID